MPGGGGQIAGRLCDGGRRSTVRPGPLEYLVADSDMCPAECGDSHRTGAEAQSLPSPDARGSGWVDKTTHYKTRLVVTTLPSSRLSFNGQIGNEAWR
jgi:hypothetical protein